MLIVAETSGISISLDPKETEDRVGSIKFDLKVKFNTQNQASEFSLNNIWIEETELNQFEAQLDKSQIAELTDMSGFTILRLQHVDDFTKLEINPIKERMSEEYDRINISMYVEYNLFTYLYRALNDYAKWW
ncbi:hypothetical protein ACJJIG_02440 [Microbulbifer sp. SSSA007]|uniref:hypothetical protein n=1 Tax=Microbulbifer sp. SSSA007 TaxID=3243379 RepID=UPI004039A029